MNIGTNVQDVSRKLVWALAVKTIIIKGPVSYFMSNKE